MSIKSYRDLVVWQRALQLAEDTYKASLHFPRFERYGLVSQLQRCAVSIPSNISEGHARKSTSEFLHFISIAMGSTAEYETQILLARRLNYVQQELADKLLAQAAEIGRMLRGLQLKLRSRSLVPSP